MPAPRTATKPLLRRPGTVADVADHYGVSTRTVWRWIRAGHLTAYRVGARAVRVDLDDLDKLARRIPAAKSA